MTCDVVSRIAHAPVFAQVVAWLESRMIPRWRRDEVLVQSRKRPRSIDSRRQTALRGDVVSCWKHAAHLADTGRFKSRARSRPPSYYRSQIVFRRGIFGVNTVEQLLSGRLDRDLCEFRDLELKSVPHLSVRAPPFKVSREPSIGAPSVRPGRTSCARQQGGLWHRGGRLGGSDGKENG